MRVLLVPVVIVPLAALGWLAERRARRQSIDVLLRRVEGIERDADDEDVRESARKCLYHLDALAGWFGRPREGKQVELDTPDEERLLLQAMGLAGVKEARAGFFSEIWDSMWRRAWRKVKSWLWHSLPWGMIGVYLWFVLKRRRAEIQARKRELEAKQRAIVQYDAAIERLPDSRRKAIGVGAELRCEHARIRNGE